MLARHLRRTSSERRATGVRAADRGEVTRLRAVAARELLHRLRAKCEQHAPHQVHLSGELHLRWPAQGHRGGARQCDRLARGGLHGSVLRILRADLRRAHLVLAQVLAAGCAGAWGHRRPHRRLPGRAGRGREQDVGREKHEGMNCGCCWVTGGRAHPAPRGRSASCQQGQRHVSTACCDRIVSHVARASSPASMPAPSFRTVGWPLPNSGHTPAVEVAHR
mmetsp:Transcript_1411/g.3800  ORF Transcript_1411/g.3800 Transcript_1411/m.3800 type:complete len:221 (+) Transcript_1411:201-863(+)